MIKVAGSLTQGMLFAGSDDGVYRVNRIYEPDNVNAEKVLDAEQVFRIRQFDAVEGLFVTAQSGLYHSHDGSEWTTLSLPEKKVYAVAANPTGDRLYAGTRPARVYVTTLEDGIPSSQQAWDEVSGFQTLREETDWGLPRHDGIAQIRSLCIHPDAPDRLVAGIEVGGIHVSDDGGATWTTRRITGFDAPHTDDIHHLTLEDSETLLASTGSGLYRSTDVGRTWQRLDRGYRQRYFREAFVHDESIYAGAAPGSTSSWDEDTDHALFECHDGQSLERVPSSITDEVAIGWCTISDDVVTVTHRGTLLKREAEGWQTIGTVPTPGSVQGRYLPLSWYEP